MFKAVVILLLIGVVASMGSSLFFLTKDKSNSKKTVNALTVRVALSVSLFVLLLVAWQLGWIEPHGVGR